GRQKRVGEALDLCDQAWRTCRPGAVAAASVYVVRVGKGTPEQQQRVEGRIRAALQGQPQLSSLHVLLAEVLDLRGRQEEAVAMYRTVLARDAQNVVALNNLAYLLALSQRAPEARELIEIAIRLAGPQAELLDTRAVVALQSNQVDQAVRDLQDAIAQQPSGS